jgi:hypothetical protein
MKQEKCSNDILRYFHAGWIFTERLFNYENLSHGVFKKFICNKSFTYDSDIFNSALSSFTRSLTSEGHFIITGNVIGKNNLLIRNSFSADYLNRDVEDYNEAFKFVPTFICDVDLLWCIYLDNDTDAFISWVSPKSNSQFEKAFFQEKDEFYYESDDDVFLDVIVNRLSFLKDFDKEIYTKTIISHNSELFKKEIK